MQGRLPNKQPTSTVENRAGVCAGRQQPVPQGCACNNYTGTSFIISQRVSTSPSSTPTSLPAHHTPLATHCDCHHTTAASRHAGSLRQLTGAAQQSVCFCVFVCVPDITLLSSPTECLIGLNHESGRRRLPILLPPEQPGCCVCLVQGSPPSSSLNIVMLLS